MKINLRNLNQKVVQGKKAITKEIKVLMKVELTNLKSHKTMMLKEAKFKRKRKRGCLHMMQSLLVGKIRTKTMPVQVLQSKKEIPQEAVEAPRFQQLKMRITLSS